MRLTRRLVIHGQVQGVFYRGWSVEQARALALAGWVRNRRDGTVEMLVSGEEEAVKEMIARCPVGPSAARVQRIEVEESAEEAPAGFESRPTV
ncbi:MAG: acylphosphatase [Alphaproteobacteria bacterium]|nr:MAG: acylphosphatase [Alphaproteobacteria bacterium]